MIDVDGINMEKYVCIPKKISGINLETTHRSGDFLLNSEENILNKRADPTLDTPGLSYPGHILVNFDDEASELGFPLA